MTSPRPRTLRATALATGVAVVGLALAGCSTTNRITTEDPYGPSDGIRVALGDVRGSNLLVVSEAEGEPGNLLGGLVNEGTEPRTVTVSRATTRPTSSSARRRPCCSVAATLPRTGRRASSSSRSTSPRARCSR